MQRTNYSKGYIVEFEVPCFESWLLIPGENLWADWVRGFLYIIAILYIFLGIAIASDIFMFSIEMITSKKRLIVAFDFERHEKVEREVFFWNETVANLTLMALGSSAPEILIAVIETVTNLSSDAEQGLGTFTIIGSAAYNLLVIPAVCIMSVPSSRVKRVAEFGVFIVTSVWSLFAYLWLVIVLKWSSPDEVEDWEAGLTLSFFPLLVITAWFQDRGWWLHKMMIKPHVVSVEGPSKSPREPENKRHPLPPTVIGVQPVNAQQSSFHFTLENGQAEKRKKISSEYKFKGVSTKSKLRDLVHLVKETDPKSATVQGVVDGIRRYIEPSASRTRARARFKHAVISSIIGRKRHADSPDETSSIVLKAIQGKASGHTKESEANNLIGKFSFSSATYSVVRSTKELIVEVLFIGTKKKGKRIGFSHVVDAARLNNLVGLPKNGSIDFNVSSQNCTSRPEAVKHRSSSPYSGGDLCLTPKASLSGKNAMVLAVYSDNDALSESISTQRTTVTSLGEGEEGDEFNSFWELSPTESAGRPLTAETAFSRSPSRERKIIRTPASLELVEIQKRGSKPGAEEPKWTVSVEYETREGSAKKGEDFHHTCGVLVFSDSECRKPLSIPVVEKSDNAPSGDDFFVILKSPSENTALGCPDVARVTLIDDHRPGELLFKEATYHVDDETSTVIATVVRIQGCDGKIAVTYRTLNGTGFGGDSADLERGACDFLRVDDGLLEFNNGETTKNIIIKVNPEAQKEKTFIILLSDVSYGARLGHRCAAIVSMTSEVDELVNEVINMIDQETEKKSIREQWSEQFTEAMTIGSNDEGAGFTEHILHFLSFFWKVLLAFIPPRNLWGGWATFLCSLAVLGVLSAFVEQFAKLFGCVIGLQVSVTGITLIALGTSMPDTFASRSAAKQDETADAAIGNVTGSNSVNVFLGLGLPWVINVVYRKRQGKKLMIKDADLYFTVLVFMACGVCCIFLLVARRIFAKGELGGSRLSKYSSGLLLILLWIVFILLCSFRAYNILPPI